MCGYTSGSTFSFAYGRFLAWGFMEVAAWCGQSTLGYFTFSRCFVIRTWDTFVGLVMTVSKALQFFFFLFLVSKQL